MFASNGDMTEPWLVPSSEIGNGRTQRRSKYGAKRPKPGQAAAAAKGKKK